jgi:hypothetical protein
MAKKWVRAAGALALAAMVISVPAQAACWSDEAMDAARVRDMDTMLMVSALRCRATDHEFLIAYNRFVQSSYKALSAANERLHAQFAGGSKGVGYDRFVTSLANHYGAGQAGLNCDDMRAILHAAAAEGDSLPGLIRLARASGADPKLDSPQCTLHVAVK